MARTNVPPPSRTLVGCILFIARNLNITLTRVMSGARFCAKMGPMSNGSLGIPAVGGRLLYLVALLALITSSATSQTAGQTPSAATPDSHRAMLSTYCFTCHSTRMKMGGLALEGLNLQTPEENAQIWEKA